jgi:TRAP-type C4-dicarboxylate transport system substrate-binding protein
MKTRKKLIVVVKIYLPVLLLIALLIPGYGGSGDALAKSKNKPVILQYSNPEPPVAFASPAQQAFADEVEKRTDGKYKIEIAWGGAMGKMEDHYDLVRNGIADFSFFLPPLTPGIFPMSDISSLPWILPNSEVSVKAMWKLYKAGYLDDEFRNIKPVFVWAGPGQQIFTAEPIEKISDIRGKKIISHSEINNEILRKAMGAVPVFIPHGEMYGAVQKGVVDGMLFVWVGILPFNLHEVVHYSVDLSFGNITCVIAMNKSSYKNIPLKVREIISEASEDTILPLMIKGYNEITMAGKDLFNKAGGKEIIWPSSNIDKMRLELSPLWTEWITKKEAQGLPAREAVDFMWNTLKEHGVEDPAIGYRPDK